MPSGLLNGNIKYQADQFQRRQVHEREGGEPGREEDDKEPTFEVNQKLCKPIQEKPIQILAKGEKPIQILAKGYRPCSMHCNEDKPIQRKSQYRPRPVESEKRESNCQH